MFLGCWFLESNGTRIRSSKNSKRSVSPGEERTDKGTGSSGLQSRKETQRLQTCKSSSTNEGDSAEQSAENSVEGNERLFFWVLLSLETDGKLLMFLILCEPINFSEAEPGGERKSPAETHSLRLEARADSESEKKSAGQTEKTEAREENGTRGTRQKGGKRTQADGDGAVILSLLMCCMYVILFVRFSR